MLKYQTVRLVHVQDWNAFVKQAYNRPYNLQQQDGCMNKCTVHLTVPAQAEDFPNTSIPEVINGDQMGVTFKAWMLRDPAAPVGGHWDKDFIKIFWERNFYPELDTLANDLYSQGLLEAGEYLINIDW